MLLREWNAELQYTHTQMKILSAGSSLLCLAESYIYTHLNSDLYHYLMFRSLNVWKSEPHNLSSLLDTWIHLNNFLSFVQNPKIFRQCSQENPPRLWSFGSMNDHSHDFKIKETQQYQVTRECHTWAMVAARDVILVYFAITDLDKFRTKLWQWISCFKIQT